MTTATFDRIREGLEDAIRVERVARAICNTFAREGNDFIKFDEAYKPCWRVAAKAAIAALDE